MRNVTPGYTLLELMIALTVASALVALLVPAWTGALTTAQRASAQAAVIRSILEAARHSAHANTDVVICAPADPFNTRCSKQTNWSGGWLVFADQNGDRRRDPDEGIVSTHAALGKNVRLQTTGGRTKLVFHPSGGNAGSNVTLTLCDARGPSKASAIALANNGQIREAKPTVAATIACMSAFN